MINRKIRPKNLYVDYITPSPRPIYGGVGEIIGTIKQVNLTLKNGVHLRNIGCDIVGIELFFCWYFSLFIYTYIITST